MLAELLTATVLLILVLDPFGNLPIVVSLLAKVPPERRTFVIVRECIFAFVILLAFMVGGSTFMHVLKLSDEALTIAGGVILFLIAIKMVFPSKEGIFGDLEGGEPFLVPLAVPAIAGPSALATVMLMASRSPDHMLTWTLAITIGMVVTTVVLLAAPWLQRVLGQQMMTAFERLMGMLLTALSVEMLLTGIRTVIQAYVK